MTRRLTVAQALVRFLAAQYSERDGVEQRLIAGCFGIFGHGNVAGVGQALLEAEVEDPEAHARTYLARNEQAMVHAAVGYARMRNRLSTLGVHDLDRPGRDEHGHRRGAGHDQPAAGAAAARRHLRHPRREPGAAGARGPGVATTSRSTTASAPCRRFFDRINRPEQLVSSALAAMRVLTDPVETGAVCPRRSRRTCRPRRTTGRRSSSPARVWPVRRPVPEPEPLPAAAALLRGARRPLIVAGGGTIYAEATGALRAFAEQTGIPVAETQAGKGSLPYDHPQRGRRDRRDRDHGRQRARPRGRRGARRRHALERLHDRLAHASSPTRTSRFVNLNVAPVDAYKHAGLALVADARRGLEALGDALAGWRGGRGAQRARAASSPPSGTRRSRRAYTLGHGPLPAQSEVIGAVNRRHGPARRGRSARRAACPATCTSCGARATRKGYHVEYGYSCMGYEIAGGLGVKLAAPDREVVVMVGDGSYLMMAQEIVTAVQEHVKLIARARPEPRLRVHRRAVGVASAPSASAPATATATRRPGSLDGDLLPVDLAANAASLGADVLTATTIDEFDGRVRGGARRRRHDGRARPDRPARPRARLRGVVGRARRRRRRARLHARARAPPYEGAKRDQQTYLGPRQKVTP